MTTEHTFDEPDFDSEYVSNLTEEQQARATTMARVITLNLRISEAFTDLNADQLRQWYVETFILDPANFETLKRITSNDDLDRLFHTNAWQSTEHAAIGSRLLYTLKPELLFDGPDLLNPDKFRHPKPVTDSIMRLFEPWNDIRYDPEGENWYRKVQPGQWQRVGKGAPGQSMAERWISKALNQMDLEHNQDRYQGFPMDGAKIAAMGNDQVMAVVTGVIAAQRKYRNAPTTDTNIRKLMEREPIMWLDPSTLNRIRTMTPFANGMLALVNAKFAGVENELHEIRMGELRPMHHEYMVTNANSLKWADHYNRVPDAVEMAFRNETNWTEVNELEDDLMLSFCPTYWSFLTHAFQEHDERAAFMRLLGAAMYGTNLKIVAAMIGEPNAGKDTVINWLSYLMPGQVASLPFSAFTPHGDEDRGFAPLMGARVATVSGEVGEGRGSKLLAEKIKTVSSGGGSLRVAEKYEKPTTIWFDGMLFLQGNSVPTIAGGDRALYENRLVAVEFKHPFSLKSVTYEAKYRSEAGAFAQVLFLNYVRYQEKGGGMDGINPPKSWKAFAREFADAANPHGFIENSIVRSEDPVSTSQFHAALSAMAQKYGSPYPVGPNFWPKRLRALGFPTKGPGSFRKQIGPERKWAYYLTVDADKSDGAFTQAQWEAMLRDVAVTA